MGQFPKRRLQKGAISLFPERLNATRFSSLDRDLRILASKELKIHWIYHHSTGIEGNTMSLEDTAFLIQEDLTVAGKSLKEHNEVMGHARAVDLLGELVEKKHLTEKDLFTLHKAVQTDTVLDIFAPVGAFKVEPNGCYVRHEDGSWEFHTYPSPEKIPFLMKEWLEILNGSLEKGEMSYRVCFHPSLCGRERTHGKASCQCTFFGLEYPSHPDFPGRSEEVYRPPRGISGRSRRLGCFLLVFRKRGVRSFCRIPLGFVPEVLENSRTSLCFAGGEKYETLGAVPVEVRRGNIMSEKTYEASHPWIVFQHDFSKASRKFWMLLGAVQSKCCFVAKAPLLPEAAREIQCIYEVKGISATAAIEGNTLREEDVQALLRGGLELPPSCQFLKQEVENISQACNKIGEQILGSTNSSISVGEILGYNRDVLRNLKLAKSIIPGEYRTYPVRVANYLGAPAQDCPHLLDKLVAMLRDLTNPQRPILGEEFRVASSILAAILSHLYIAWIHPFGDGNGRTARLLEFRLLLEAGVPIPAAHLLSNHYNKTRFVYYRKLQESSRQSDGVFQFVEYALQGFLDGLEELLGRIQEEQVHTIWAQLVHEHFAKKTGAATLRKRELILALIAEKEPVSADINRIRQLSPELFDEYSKRTKKTLSRDINELVEEKFVVKIGDRIKANTNLVRALIP